MLTKSVNHYILKMLKIIKKKEVLKMKHTIYKIAGVALASTLLLGACDDAEQSTKAPDKKAIKETKSELVYYEILNNGDSEYPKTDIAYKSKKHKEVKHIHPEIDKVHEHILSNGDDKPYVVQDGNKFHIYRPPYMTYSDEEVEGDVKDKDEVKK